MSEVKDHTVFLEHSGYRYRRLQDAALILPVLAFVLFVLPLAGLGTVADGAAPTRVLGIYFFVVWIVVVGACAALSRRLVRRREGENS